MAEKPHSVTLEEHGVVDMGDARTPAHGLATPPPYVERKVAEAKQETLATLLKTRLVAMLVTGGFSAATLGGVAYAYETLETKAKDAGTAAAKTEIATVDAGLEGVKARLTVVEQQRASDRAEFNARFERLENQGNRSEKKLDALLDAQGVRNPAPAPKDGGP